MKSLNFMIVGVQKGGTTALASFLSQHAEIEMSKKKEVHLFDSPNYSSEWSSNDINACYDAHFNSSDLICGEATPIYCYWPAIAPALKQYNPDLKLIVLLRDPVERAISHYMMEKGRKKERWPMALAFLLERWRLRFSKRSSGELSEADRVCSYLDRGHYAKQLSNLRQYFNDEQILVLESDQLLQKHDESLSTVLTFLGVKDQAIPTQKVIFKGDYKKDVGRCYAFFLRHYFRKSNKQLKVLLAAMGYTVNWPWLH